MDTMPPETPAKPDAAEGKSNDEILNDAESAGKLEPIKMVLDKLGRTDMPAKEVLRLAQHDDRTNGKSPEDLAKMIEEDDALLDDLAEYQAGGMFHARGMGKGMKPGHSEAAEGEPPAGSSGKPDAMM